jgi:hypothetical protein
MKTKFIFYSKNPSNRVFYWLPLNLGYTEDITEAHLFTGKEATDAFAHCVEHELAVYVMPVDNDFLKILNAKIEALTKKKAQIEQN